MAEVEAQDAWQLATIGIACVANTPRHCDEVLDEVVAYVETTRLDAEVLDIEREVIPFG